MMMSHCHRKTGFPETMFCVVVGSFFYSFYFYFFSSWGWSIVGMLSMRSGEMGGCGGGLTGGNSTMVTY